jgi:hypothetical protein
VLAITLPADVLRWLKSLHPDPAWAIVSLYDRATGAGQPEPDPVPFVELAKLGGDQSLIVVDPHAYHDLRDAVVLPMSQNRAFLALEAGKTIADLELSIRELIEDPRTDSDQLAKLWRLLDKVRRIRRSRLHRVSTRSIIVVEKQAPRRRRSS